MVTLIQAAREVDLSRERLRQLIRDGLITDFEKVGRGFRIPRREVERLKREPRPKPGPKGPRQPKSSPLIYDSSDHFRATSRVADPPPPA